MELSQRLLYMIYSCQSGTIFIGTGKHGIAYLNYPTFIDPFLRAIPSRPHRADNFFGHEARHFSTPPILV